MGDGDRLMKMVKTWLWAMVAISGGLSTLGFALAFTVAPDAINMALGAGIALMMFLTIYVVSRVTEIPDGPKS